MDINIALVGVGEKLLEHPTASVQLQRCFAYKWCETLAQRVSAALQKIIHTDTPMHTHATSAQKKKTDGGRAGDTQRESMRAIVSDARRSAPRFYSATLKPLFRVILRYLDRHEKTEREWGTGTGYIRAEKGDRDRDRDEEVERDEFDEAVSNLLSLLHAGTSNEVVLELVNHAQVHIVQQSYRFFF
jgi:hypothetical protein